MKINNIQNINQTSFGMALYIDKKGIERSFGPNILMRVQDSIPALKKIAKDVDIFIKPGAQPKSFACENNVIYVTAQEQCVSWAKKMKSKLGFKTIRKDEQLCMPNWVRYKGMLEGLATKAKENLLGKDI